eukprot:CAMPEP_0118813878 /NCGR_PEP_ID=MMETSP1162-20130426/3224_1 /TAXON_ID=33656 /ORGANISM="Phaeocystis Sp, Strain CCMP2710" /LENGTH=271 /DNA_ID=CAMNT_0006743719 /DNA_START=144 /DNA_END=958 /DNA_ORIENTATION=+
MTFHLGPWSLSALRPLSAIDHDLTDWSATMHDSSDGPSHGFVAVEVEVRRQPHLLTEVDVRHDVRAPARLRALPFLARATASAAQPRENRRKQVPGPGAVEIEIDDDARAVVQEDITRLDDVRHDHPVHSCGMVQCSQSLAQLGPGHGLGVTVRPPPPLVSIGHEQDGHVAVDRRRVPRIPFRKAVVQMVVDDLRAPAVWRARSHRLDDSLGVHTYNMITALPDLTVIVTEAGSRLLQLCVSAAAPWRANGVRYQAASRNSGGSSQRREQP